VDTNTIVVVGGIAFFLFVSVRYLLRRRRQARLNNQTYVRTYSNDQTPANNTSLLFPAAIVASLFGSNNQAQSAQNPANNDIGASSDSVGASTDSGSSGGDSGGGGGDGGGGGGSD
jgi:uncharacterized membrane protein YgcG